MDSVVKSKQLNNVNNIKNNKRVIRDRQKRLEEIEKEKIEKLCPSCRRVAKRENGKWVKKEIKPCPTRKNNNREYINFIQGLRKENEYKDMPYLQFVSLASKIWKDEIN